MAKWDHDDLKDKSSQQYKAAANQQIGVANQAVCKNIANNIDRDLETIQHQREVIEDLIQTNARMRAALLLIKEHKMPYSGFSWDKGSNGVRDHFIGIAEKGLS